MGRDLDHARFTQFNNWVVFSDFDSPYFPSDSIGSSRTRMTRHNSDAGSV